MPVEIDDFEVVPEPDRPASGSQLPPRRSLEDEVERLERLLAERAERLRADEC